MKKYIPPKEYHFSDDETMFSTTDKGCAIVMFEYAKKKLGRDMDKQIAELKEEIQNESN